jgi:hypothetical protein
MPGSIERDIAVSRPRKGRDRIHSRCRRSPQRDTVGDSYGAATFLGKRSFASLRAIEPATVTTSYWPW